MRIELNQAIERMHAVNDKINAVVTEIEVTDEERTGKLANVPVVLKDNINTKGIRTTASSRILDNYVPVYDATIVKKLKAAGAAFIAKASMDELGMGGTNKNAFTGPVHNPYDLNRIAGGSSGGSAAMVASGCTSLAIGTDTGDSIRKPAAYCGVIGVKPTYGRISRYGVIPYASSLDHVGYFTTNVKDAALALEVLAGRDNHDLTSSNLPVENYSENLNTNLAGKTIAVLKTVNDAFENETFKNTFCDLIEKVKAAGANVVEVEMPIQYMELIAPIYETIANAEAAANHANLDGIRFGMREPGESVDEVMTNSRTKGFSSNVRERFVVGSYTLFDENQDRILRKAQKLRRLLVESYAKCFEGVDAVLCLAAPTVAPLMEEEKSDTEFTNEHMPLANFSGYPSMTLPLGKENGLPFGMSLTCRPFEEQTMFDIAGGLEELTGLKDQFLEGEI